MLADFELRKPYVVAMDKIPEDIYFSTPLISRDISVYDKKNKINIRSQPPAYQVYKKAFDHVRKNIAHGNSYLINLTFPSKVETDLDLKDIFCSSRAKYRLLYRDEFVVFSPETFVEIKNSTIRSFPMKGTIDASEDNALDKILGDEKELSEHNTIVDLIRNDLSMVAREVNVPRYRYHEYIRAGERKLIQISSEIKGRLDKDWQSRLGDIIISLLPAGSISGAPKAETLRIIKESEADKRGYYTGIFGVYDGTSFDSAVMIRFIEQIDGKYVYRSGGGITYLSDPVKEYKELTDKIYVPFA